MCVVVKLAPALAAGNTLVVKPSEYTPLSSMLLCQLVHEAGFPPGVYNSVTGMGAAAGAPLAASPDIDMVSFTGSIPTGTAIMAAAAANVTKPLLELGGKSAAIVFDDVDVDEVTPWLMQGFCQNAGQVCVCHTRAIVHESVKDQLIQKLVAEVETIPFATVRSHLPTVLIDRIRDTGFVVASPALSTQPATTQISKQVPLSVGPTRATARAGALGDGAGCQRTTT